MYARSKLLNKKRLCGVLAVAMSLTVAATGVYSGFVASAEATKYTVNGTYEDCLSASREVNKQIMEEGMVLLKNKNDALPLASGSKISLFGFGSYNTLWGETGAGNGKTDYVYMEDSLKAAGFSVNPNIKSVYEAVYSAEPSVDKLDGVKSSFSSYNDVAIITFSRAGAESGDLSITKPTDTTTDITHALRLTDKEQALVDLVKSSGFGKIIVLMNCPTSMEIGELKNDEKIDAIMYIGQPGEHGLEALGEVLNGSVSPSGRTVSAWAADFTKTPVFANGVVNTDDINGTMSVEYEEGIYLGYKYYETAYAEAQNNNYAGFDYDQEVVYPFGYGLSYTTFAQELVTESISIPANATFDTYLDVEVKVTNTGEVAGKCVVQIYNHAPYTLGEIEKCEVVLVGFAKTELIDKGASDTVTVKVRVGDLASYDYNDANHNDWYGYEIEAGEGYELRLQSDSHTKLASLPYTVDSTIKFENDGTRANSNATNDVNATVFSTGDDFDSLALVSAQNGGDFKAMSRADFAGTFPTAPTGKNNYVNGVNTKYSDAFTPDMDDESDPWYVDEVPSEWTQGADTKYILADMVGIDPLGNEAVGDDVWGSKTGAQAWTEFMNQLTWDELKAIVRTGAHLTIAVESIQKPKQADKDGPEQLGDGTFWACANIIAGTFNEDLVEERGVAIGNEGLFQGLSGWYGPTANLNRTPFCGRNTIYSSEDALLTGKIAAANIRGAQSRGVICYLKHFALNEQETGRTGLATFLSEQALRETYLKAFEIGVKEGHTLALMQAMNRVGGINCYGNYALDVEVLRNEWHFNGTTLTDAYNAALVRENMAQRMGCDIPLGSFTLAVAGDWDETNNTVTYEGEESLTQWSVVRNAAMHVLYMAANSSQLANGYNMFAITNNAYTGNLTFQLLEEITPIDVSIDTDSFGTDKVVYSAVNLPEGLTIDAQTGIISGTPTAPTPSKNNPTITITVRVTNEGEEWIAATFSLGKMVVEGELPSPGGSLPTGAIIGIVVGCVAVVAAAGIAVFFVMKKKKSAVIAEKTESDDKTDDNGTQE